MKNKGRKISSFTQLKTWQKGHALVLEIYKLSKKFPKEEIYGLTSQIRRSAISITSNIAEGFGRKGRKEKVQFYHQALGSLGEFKNQLLIVKDIGYLKLNKKIVDLSNETEYLLRALINASKR